MTVYKFPGDALLYILRPGKGYFPLSLAEPDRFREAEGLGMARVIVLAHYRRGAR